MEYKLFISGLEHKIYFYAFKYSIMKKVISALVILTASVFLFYLSGCKEKCIKGSGKQVTENRKVTDFTAIEIAGGFKVVLKQDSSLALKITADDNLLKIIKTTVSGGKLSISTASNLCSSGSMLVVIGINKLESIATSGAVEIKSDGKLNAKDIKLGLSGATKVTMDINAANVSTEISGLTELNLTGQAASHDIKITGTGKVNALDFVTGSSTIDISGIGHCQVNVLNALNVHSKGVSEVKYKGNPSKVNNDKTGASSVEKIN